MRTHEQYEELCAQAAIGGLSESEWADLQPHLQTCSACRLAAAEFFRLGVDVLPMLGQSCRPGAVPAGMKERLLRIIQAEIFPSCANPEEKPVPRLRQVIRRHLWAAWVASLAAAVVLTAIVVSRLERNNHSASSVRETPQASSVSHPNESNGLASKEPSHAERPLQQQLRSAQEQLEVLKTQLKRQEEALEAARRERTDLAVRIEQLNAENARVRDGNAQREDELAMLRRVLERSRSEENATRTAAAVTEAELKDAQSQISQLSAQLTEEQRQRIVLTNAQNMIVARNLHVLDVRDANEDGRPMRAFGRIFYTEGEKLDFYAYDLDDPGKIATTGSFYVWGEKPGTAQKVVSLGRFHIDSEPDGRWLLRVTDPHLLSQVTSVFVTFEPKSGGVMQPTGRRILTRLLTTEANHP